MKKKLMCLICAVVLVAAVGTTVYVTNKPGDSQPQSAGITVLHSNEDNYALSLLGYDLGYAVIDEGAQSDAVTLGEWLQIGFVDEQTLASLTAAQVIAADEAARQTVVPIVYQTTCSSDKEHNLFWDITATALDDTLTLQSLNAVIFYPDDPDSGEKRADSFLADCSEPARELKASALSSYTFPDESELPVRWEFRLGLGGDGAFETDLCGSGVILSHAE